MSALCGTIIISYLSGVDPLTLTPSVSPGVGTTAAQPPQSAAQSLPHPTIVLPFDLSYSLSILGYEIHYLTNAAIRGTGTTPSLSCQTMRSDERVASRIEPRVPGAKESDWIEGVGHDDDEAEAGRQLSSCTTKKDNIKPPAFILGEERQAGGTDSRALTMHDNQGSSSCGSSELSPDRCDELCGCGIGKLRPVDNDRLQGIPYQSLRGIDHDLHQGSRRPGEAPCDPDALSFG